MKSQCTANVADQRGRSMYGSASQRRGVAVTHDTELLRSMYAAIARGNAIADAETDARNMWRERQEPGWFTGKML